MQLINSSRHCNFSFRGIINWREFKRHRKSGKVGRFCLAGIVPRIRANFQRVPIYPKTSQTRLLMHSAQNVCPNTGWYYLRVGISRYRLVWITRNSRYAFFAFQPMKIQKYVEGELKIMKIIIFQLDIWFNLISWRNLSQSLQYWRNCVISVSILRKKILHPEPRETPQKLTTAISLRKRAQGIFRKEMKRNKKGTSHPSRDSQVNYAEGKSVVEMHLSRQAISSFQRTERESSECNGDRQ